MSYNTIEIEEELDIGTQQAHWLAVVLPFSVVDPVDRSKLISTGSNKLLAVDSDGAEANAVKVEGVYLLDNEIINWSVSSSKESPMGSLGLTLAYGQKNWLQQLSPGDWILFWAFEDRASYLRIIDTIRANYDISINSKVFKGKVEKVDPKLNFFESGLKFVGRIGSIRESLSKSSDGFIDGGYSVSASSFTEFNSVLYYDPRLALPFSSYAQFLGSFGVETSVLFSSAKKTENYVNTTEIVPILSNIILGKDPQGINASASPSKKFLVPQILGAMLGLGREAERVTDLHRYYSGRQRYQQSTDEKWQSLVPQIEKTNDNTFITPYPFSDLIFPQVFDLKGNSAWGIMKGYVNEPINELFTAMKPDPTGKIMPSIIFRTNPLTSEDMSKLSPSAGFDTTSFFEYPAWNITTNRVTEYSIGRSDNARLNYVEIQADDKVTQKKQEQTRESNRIFAPPAAVTTDISRNGLRMFVQKVPSVAFDRTVSPTQNMSRIYTSIMGDILLDSHLRFSGSVSMEGVQLPISHGDNAIINGIMFHIETVSHFGGINPEGKKDFSTSLSLSHGIPLPPSLAPRNDDDPAFERKVVHDELSRSRNSRKDLAEFIKLSTPKIGSV